MNINKFKSNVEHLIGLCKRSEINGWETNGICELVHNIDDNPFYTADKIKSYIKTIKWLFLFRDYVINDISSYYYNTDFRTNSKTKLFTLKYSKHYHQLFYKEMIKVRINFLKEVLKLDNSKIIEIFQTHRNSQRI